MASGRRATIEANHPGDVLHVCACGRKRQAMPRPSLSHTMRLQPPYASSWSLMWPEIVSRDWQLRSVRVLGFWLASMATLVGSVVEELTDSNVSERSTCRRGPLGASRRLVRTALNAWSNVEIWPYTAYWSRIYMSSARPDGLKSNGDRARTWRAVPSIPLWDPICRSVM